jgi:hypothetical protein
MQLSMMVAKMLGWERGGGRSSRVAGHDRLQGIKV